MTNRSIERDLINFERAFLWTRLFRTFRIAVGYQKVFLAALGLLVFACGDYVLHFLPYSPPENADRAIWPWEAYPVPTPLSTTGALTSEPGAALQVAAFQNGSTVLIPAARIVAPARELLQERRRPLQGSELRTRDVGIGPPAFELIRPRNQPRDERSTLARATWSLTQLFWTLIVWSIFGGAIARMAALQFARDERLGAVAALRFSCSRFLSFFSAPLLPASFAALLGLLCVLAGLFGRIPFVGEVVVGVLYFFALLAGFVMALVLVGLAVAWPLMYATIATEDSDAFDGLSRSFAYVYDRPWYYLWLAILALIYGSLVIFFAALVAQLVVYLPGQAVGLGLGESRDVASTLGAGFPDQGIIARLSAGWARGIHVLLIGFIFSYFWCVSTVIYFLLRRRDDGIELTEIFVADEEEHGDLPLVGVAASEQPVTERPAEGGEAPEGGAGEERPS